MIDIHNFARYNDQIIGQGGPSNSDFASFWGALAGKYADKERIIFGVMNEPHHLDVQDWVNTCQEAVTAIRKAGATSQMILLPGTNFDSAATLLETGGLDALMNITNPDGSVDGLVLDVHKYLDEDNSGTHEECVTDNIDSFRKLAGHLRNITRLALVSETGASHDSSVSLPRFVLSTSLLTRGYEVPGKVLCAK
jgi:endoglucanase